MWRLFCCLGAGLVVAAVDRPISCRCSRYFRTVEISTARDDQDTEHDIRSNVVTPVACYSSSAVQSYNHFITWDVCSRDRHQLIQDDGSWAEAATVALTTGDEVGTGGKEARLEQLLQRTQR